MNVAQSITSTIITGCNRTMVLAQYTIDTTWDILFPSFPLFFVDKLSREEQLCHSFWLLHND